jgi:hypothetical protein
MVKKQPDGMSKSTFVIKPYTAKTIINLNVLSFIMSKYISSSTLFYQS